MGKKSKRSGKKKSGGGAKRASNPTSSNVKWSNVKWSNDAVAAAAEDGKSLYELYKTATLRFKNGLMALVPATIFAKDIVHDLLDAADYIKDNNILVDSQLLADLKLAISVRKRYTKNFVDGGDEGHSYFLLVLNYCLQTLKASAHRPKETTNEREDDDNGEHDSDDDNAASNRFATLSVEDDSDEEDDEEDQKVVARPEEPSKPYSFGDLFSMPDAAQAKQYLDTISYHTMRCISAFQNLKETMRLAESGDFDHSRIPNELLGIGIITNLAVANVKHLEDALALECPHLNSPYRILACAFLAPPINLFKDTVRKYSPLARKFKDEMALAFVADIVEAIFHGKDLDEELERLTSQFNRRWKLPEHWCGKVVWMAGIVSRVTLHESITELETRKYGTEFTKAYSFDITNAPWFDGFENCTGGDRSILNTMKLLDLCASWIADGNKSPKLLLNQLELSFFQWDEMRNPAQKIRVDLDWPVMNTLMRLVDTWALSRDDSFLPRERELLPFVSQFRLWVKNFGVSTPLSIAFAFHLIVTSLYEIQGQGDIDKLASIAEATFEKFLCQCQEQLDKTGSVPSPEIRKGFLRQVLDIKKLTEVKEDEVYKFPLAFWNPVCASMLLNYVAFGCSLEAGGRCMMDDCKQTRFVLHLYNALKQRGLVDEDLPIVSTIDDYFSDIKGLWNGWSKPEQGKFVYRFILSYGANHAYANYTQESVRYQLLGGDMPKKPEMSFHEVYRQGRERFAESNNPEEFSKSYRRICLHDYSGAEGEFVPEHMKLALKSPLPLTIQEHELRIFRSILAMQNEMDLICLNLIVVGGLFNEFMNELFHQELQSDGPRQVSQRMANVKQFTQDQDNARVLYIMELMQPVLGSLDYLNDSDDMAFIGRQFEEFFGSIDPNDVRIFHSSRR